MDIASINSLTSSAFKQRDSDSKSKLGQQEFLQLLVAQMRNQDPINPLDGAEFAAQLAQFNSVEQLINVNNGLQRLEESQELMSSSMINSMAASLTGKNVRALSDEIHLAAGAGSNVNFDLNSSAETVEIIIRNSAGSEVRREVLSGIPSGSNNWEWDGFNDGGARMPEGNYHVEIKASSESGDVGALIFTEGIAEKIRYTGNGVFLLVNNIQIPIGDVQEVSK